VAGTEGGGVANGKKRGGLAGPQHASIYRLANHGPALPGTKKF